MPFYRTDDGQGTMHVNFGRRSGPLPCVGPMCLGDNPTIGQRCARMSVALCDFPTGTDVDGKPLTCDAPMCERHRTRVGANVDHCRRHASQLPLPEVKA